jgi:hypothetical protein
MKGRWFARSTMFATFFAVTAFILALKGMLTGQYVAMCGSVQAMIVGRAIASDYHDRNCKEEHKGDQP